MIDNTMRSMYCEALYRDGELLVSIEWFSRYLMNLHVSNCDGVAYAADHFNVLSTNMADLIRDLLKTGGELSDYQKIAAPKD